MTDGWNQLDLSVVVEGLVGYRIRRPRAGALAGHAVGEPFDKRVQELLSNEFPGRTFRHYELLNALFRAAGDCGYGGRLDCLGPRALQRLLARGKSAMEDWTSDLPFEEKQDDTADIVVLPGDTLDLNVPTVHLVDVKTTRMDKRGQPPNIISAKKVAEMSRLMLEDLNFDSHDIWYVDALWELAGDELVCGEVAVCSLFSIPPASLYINWSAGLQIQFLPHKVPQTFDGSGQDWCIGYLRHFVGSAERRIAKMADDWIAPYKTFLAEW